MKHRLLNRTIVTALSGIALSILIAGPSFAQITTSCTAPGQVYDPTLNSGAGGCTAINKGTLAGGSPYVIISNVINIALGFLGLVSLVIFLVAGFQWMTSGGDEGKIKNAKKLMKSAIIGIVIVLVAYVASNFVMQTIFQATKTGVTTN